MMRAHSLSCILLLKLAGSVYVLPDFFFDGGDSLEDHFRLGAAMGVAYRDSIQQRMKDDVRELSPFLASSQGQKVFGEFLRVHQQQVPELIQEMEGIANGSGVAFDTLFAVSLKEELSYFSDQNSSAYLRADDCSDYMMCTKEHCVDGHNEDGDFQDRHMFTAFVRLGKANFTVLNYVGDLLGGMSALAFNAAGLAFSLNKVSPARCTTDGLGRNFISRLLLGAQSWDDALSIISTKHAAGHNYQLMDFGARRIANIEAANANISVREISTPFFHANQYTTLDVPGQQIGNSSLHRIARVKELPIPQTPVDVLQILGDQGDHSWPIFHDTYSHDHGDLSDWTLASALFDLDLKRISLMAGNPKTLVVKRTFDVPAPIAARSTVVVV